MAEYKKNSGIILSTSPGWEPEENSANLENPGSVFESLNRKKETNKKRFYRNTIQCLNILKLGLFTEGGGT